MYWPGTTNRFRGPVSGLAALAPRGRPFDSAVAGFEPGGIRLPDGPGATEGILLELGEFGTHFYILPVRRNAFAGNWL